jgi:uncharacterized protein (TIGR02246 family)
MSADDDIRDLLATYERALNTDDTTLAVSCYTGDGVFMPTTLPTAAGQDALRRAYADTFAAIHLDVTFTVDELVVATEHIAFALTRSSGTQTTHATGAQSAESNREMFIFRVEAGAWKISRYIFNKPH